MCDLMTGLMVASTAMNATGSILAGRAEAAAYRSDAKMADANRNYLNHRIADEREIAAVEGRRIGEDAATVIGRQETYAAAGNVDATFGTPLQAIIQSAQAAARDAAFSADNNMRTTRDLRVEQANLKTSANTSRANAKGATRGGYMKAVGSVLSGASGIGKYRAQYGLTRDWSVGRAKVVF